MTYFDEAAATWDDEPRRVALMKAIGETILSAARPDKDMDVLDYGCGTGLVSLFLLPHVHRVTGADNSPGMLDVLRSKIAQGGIQNMDAVLLDLESDSISDRRYTMIVVSMAMHHIRRLDRVLETFHQLLEPGGIVCLADLDTEPGTFHPAEVAPTVHHHGFDREELKNRLLDIGFDDARDHTVTSFSKPTENGEEEEFSVFLVTARRSQQD